MSSYLSQITDLLTRIEREESDALCRDVVEKTSILTARADI